MKVLLSICSDTHDGCQEIRMSEQFSDYNGKDSIDIIYQDEPYCFVVDIQEQEDYIKEIELFINNEQISDTANYVESKGKYVFGNMAHKCHFLLHFGLVQISLRILFISQGEKYYYSPFIAVGIREEYVSSEKSINEMLDFVYKKEHELLYQGKPHNDSTLPQYIRNSDNRFAKEIELLRAISLTLSKQQPYFGNFANQRIIANYSIDKFYKLDSIKSENIRFIAMHPEQLRRSFTTRTIVVNGDGYEPMNTLIERKENSSDTYENRCVLSFIYSLNHHVENRLSEIKRLMEDSGTNIKTSRPVRMNYVLSYNVIQRYLQTTFNDYYKAFQIIKSQLEDHLTVYYKILGCDYYLLSMIPRPTSIFMEIHHYRAIFEVMNMWFGYSKDTRPIDYHQFHFTSADKIFEYYCLVSIYDLIVGIGYKPMAEGASKFDYKSPGGYYSQTKEDNTFKFKKENKVLTLYFQPVIYSRTSMTTNNIDLFRTDGSYYLPDFVIKVVEFQNDYDGEIQNTIYGIIDSKWRNRSILKKRDISGGLYDSINKYYFSIRKRGTTEPVDFLWLLQGKDDYEKQNEPYFFHRGNISQTLPAKFRYSTAIIQLTPNYGNNDLRDALKVYV